MAIRGTISRTNSGSHPWTSRYENGAFAGNFVSFADAKQPIESAVNHKLKWVADDVRGVEVYRGEDNT